MVNHSLKGKRRPIYYEYLELDNLNTKFHLINIDSEENYFIIPNNYNINYSKSNNSYEPKGHIHFYNKKNNYVIEYTAKTYDDFKTHMERKNNKVKRFFTNYRKQEFYEVIKSNIDYIYMYYEGFYYKIYSDHKFSFNEYYDMYLILYSITNIRYNNNIEHIKELYYFHENCLDYLFNDVDILKINLSEHINDIELKEDDIYIYNDSEYLKYKEIQNRAEQITFKLLSNINNNELNIMLVNNRWNIIGQFDFYNFGKYHDAYILDYDEIIESEELESEEKSKLLNKVVVQKQYEINSYKDKINKIFYEYIVIYLKNNITYDLWNNYHIREFINEELLSGYDDDLTDKNIYELFIKELGINNDIFIKNNILKSVRGEELVIYPDKISLKFSALNSFINSIVILFDEEYNFIDKV